MLRVLPFLQKARFYLVLDSYCISWYCLTIEKLGYVDYVCGFFKNSCPECHIFLRKKIVSRIFGNFFQHVLQTFIQKRGCCSYHPWNFWLAVILLCRICICENIFEYLYFCICCVFVCTYGSPWKHCNCWLPSCLPLWNLSNLDAICKNLRHNKQSLCTKFCKTNKDQSKYMLGSYAYIQLGKGLAKDYTTTLFTTSFLHPSLSCI